MSSAGRSAPRSLRRSPLPWLGALLGLYLLIPIAAQLVRVAYSVGPNEPTTGLPSALGVSLLTASMSTAIVALFGIPLAWTLSQARGRTWEIVGVAVQLPLALPPLMSGILLVELVGPYSFVGQLFGGRLTNSVAGIVLAQTFVASPFCVIAARSAFATIDPGLIDMAATLGHRGWSRFLRVSLPLAAPGIRAGLLLTWLRAFGEFGATEILAYHPYSLPVFTFVQFDATGLPATLAPTGAAIVAALIVLILARWRPLHWAWARWGRGSSDIRAGGVPGLGLALAGLGLGRHGAAALRSAANQRPTTQEEVSAGTGGVASGAGGAASGAGAAEAGAGAAEAGAAGARGAASGAGAGAGHVGAGAGHVGAGAGQVGAGHVGAGPVGASPVGASPVGAAAAAAAAASTPARLAFDLDTRLGSFELHLAHQGKASRLAILGPSGAGKSLTLSCLAGLRGTDVGAVQLGARELGCVAPEHRRIGWVPQDAALFPHLSVWRQVTFGIGTDLILAAHWLDRLGLTGLEDRLPSQLSGGQRQRVALARALARAPDLVLLDEPFSSLDRPVRDDLRRVLRRLQSEVGITTVLVTHDPEEAAMLADEVVVIGAGRALQSGTREEVFTRPASAQVARLLGFDNLHSGRVVGPGVVLADGTELAVPHGCPAPGTSVAWCVRSEQVKLYLGPSGQPGKQPNQADGKVLYGAVVVDVIDLGAQTELTVLLDGGLELAARTLNGRAVRLGDRCRVEIPVSAITLWDSSAGHR